MSDVWQGPGWWLASDGKWYPADAEPGAVYEGDFADLDDKAQSNDSPNEDVGIPDAVSTDPVPTGELNAIQPEPLTDQSAPTTEFSSGVTRGLFGSTPDPQPTGGGWQAISPDAADADPITAESPEGDGWTSAYEERQTVNEILGAAGGAEVVDAADSQASSVAMPAPDVSSRSLGAPEVASGGFDTPQIPDAALDATQMNMTDLGVPEVSAPQVGAPGLETPNVSAPPNLTAPDVSEPQIATSGLETPEVAMPTIDTPNVAVPPVSAPSPTPDMAVPKAPGFAIPTRGSAGIQDAPLGDSPDPAAGIGLSGATNTPSPLARDDAWRVPNETPIAARPDTASSQASPSVVDLAVRGDTTNAHPEPESKGRGRMFAGIAGLAVLVGIAILIAALLTRGDDEPTAEAESSEPAAEDVAETEPVASELGPDDVSVFDLRAGDCIIGDIGSGQVTQVTKVDCEEEHQFEVYREVLIDSSITTFDEPAISAYAEDVCRTSLEVYIPTNDDRGLMFKFLQPTEQSWNQDEEPDRVVTCLLFDDDEPLIGRAA